MNTSGPRADDIPPDNELLRGLKQKEIGSVLEEARPRRVPRESVLTEQGEPANYLFLLWKGRARYFFRTPHGKELILMWITPGHIFGVNAMVPPPSTYIVSTETVQESVVLIWEGGSIRTLARRFPQLLENLLLICADYLTWYVAAHAALTYQTARERLAHVVLGFAPSVGRPVAGGIELDVTNRELANATNLTRYTVSRIVTEWQRIGAIRKEHKKILLLSPKRLF